LTFGSAATGNGYTTEDAESQQATATSHPDARNTIAVLLQARAAALTAHNEQARDRHLVRPVRLDCGSARMTTFDA